VPTDVARGHSAVEWSARLRVNALPLMKLVARVCCALECCARDPLTSVARRSSTSSHRERDERVSCTRRAFAESTVLGRCRSFRVGYPQKHSRFRGRARPRPLARPAVQAISPTVSQDPLVPTCSIDRASPLRFGSRVDNTFVAACVFAQLLERRVARESDPLEFRTSAGDGRRGAGP
jgi:hypothetical protein